MMQSTILAKLSPNLYLVTGVTWIIRSLIEVIYHPSYWQPQNFIDYLSVILTSIAIVLLGYCMRLLFIQFGEEKSRANSFWNLTSWTILLASWSNGLSNFFEDFLDLRFFGGAFIVSSLAFVMATLLSLIPILFIKVIRRWAIPILLVMIISFTFPDQGGGIFTGLSLFALSFFKKGRK